MSKESETNENNKNIKKNSEQEEQNDSVQQDSEETAAAEKVVLPRKRKIVKNTQLQVTFGITVAAIAFSIVWFLFFNNALFGEWHYTASGETTETYEVAETYDNAAESDLSSNDSADTQEDYATETYDVVTETTPYEDSFVYEFHRDGTISVTMGSMTVEGYYNLGSSEESSKVFTAEVFFDESPILYGTYAYEIKGNIFTGRTLHITNLMDEEDSSVLERGGLDDPLTQYEDYQIDERLTGTWYDDENNRTFKFTDDGFMTIYSNTLAARHAYTIMSDNLLLVKYIASQEQTYTLSYAFDEDGKLYLDGVYVRRVA